MKTWLTIIALLALLLAAATAVGEPGDKPNCPWEYMTPTAVAQLEQTRQVVGGVKGSPYWLWQAYLGSGSLDLRLYDVDEPVFPKQMVFKERIRYGGNPFKTMTLTLLGEPEHVELRIDQASLAVLETAGIDVIVVRDAMKKQIAEYHREDIEAIMTYFALEADEMICLQGEDAPLYMYTADGVRKALTIQ